VVFSGESFTVSFDNKTGMMSSYWPSGSELLTFAPRLNVFRAFTDNDIWFQKQFWESGLGTLRHDPVTVFAEQLDDGSARYTSILQVRGFKGTGFEQASQYTVLADGTIVVDNTFTPFGNLPPTPRIGLILGIAGQFDDFTWLGRGPFESYPDRKTAADVGLYKGKVAAQFQEYVRPQENGNKEDVRWGALTNSQNRGLMFQASGDLSMSVSKYLPQQLDDARHENGEPRKFTPLIPRNDIVVCLDAKQMGLGGASCGPGPLAEFVLKPETTQFRVTIRPLRGNEDLRKLGRIRTPVPNVPTISRGDDGMVTVKGDDALVVEIDGSRVDPAHPFPLAEGGIVRAYSKNGPVAFQKFEKIIPVVSIPVKNVNASSEESDEGLAAFAIDGEPSTYWHSQYTGATPKHPHSITFYFSSPYSVLGFDYTPRQINGNGRVEDYEIQFSVDGKTFEKHSKGRFPRTTDKQRVFLERPLPQAIAVRFVALSEWNGGPWASIADLAFLRNPK
jgi:beta-galactosidase